MKYKRWLMALSLVPLLAGAACSPGNPLASTLTPATAKAENPGVELTVYNSNLGLVKDHRQMILQQGLNSVRFSDVASAIDATSVHFRSLTDPQGTVVQ